MAGAMAGLLTGGNGAVESGGGNEDTVFTIGPVAGSTQGIPRQRDWKVIFRGVSDVPGRAAGCRPAGSDAAASSMAGGDAGSRADADTAAADNKNAGNGSDICVFVGGRQADAGIVTSRR